MRILLTLLAFTFLAGPAHAKRERDEGPPPGVMRIHVLDVGQGDCTVIESPEDETGDRKILMVDAAESSKEGNEARDTIEPYLRRRLDDGPPTRPTVEVDYFVGTHYHKDHMGWPKPGNDSGLFYLYDTTGVHVDRIFDTGLDYDASGNLDGVYREWVASRNVPREKLQFDQLSEDRQIDMGPDLWIEVLNVGAQVDGMADRVVRRRWIPTTSQNDFSIALIIHYKKFDFFVAGDLSGYFHKSWGNYYHNIEGALRDQLRDLEVLRVSHHGSQWSTNYSFMQHTEPEVALISCGKGHHHPNEFTVHRILGWENYWSGWPVGSDIYQTESVDGYTFEGEHPHTGKTQTVANGHIVIETDGETGYTIWFEGLDTPIHFDLDRTPAYTDIPGKIKLRREGNTEDLPTVLDADEVDPELLEERDTGSRWD